MMFRSCRIRQDVSLFKKNIPMKPIRILFVLVLSVFLLAPVLSHAQTTGSLHGKVTDAATSQGMPAATVVLIDANQKKVGRKAKKDGTYEFQAVDPGSYTLKITYVGYKAFNSKISIEAGKDLVQDVKLENDFIGLEEVVVTGEAEHHYKSDAEVSVSTVNAVEQQQNSSYQ